MLRRDSDPCPRFVSARTLSRSASNEVDSRCWERQLDVLNLDHRQLIESALICIEAIARTEAHSEVAMKYQAK